MRSWSQGQGSWGLLEPPLEMMMTTYSNGATGAGFGLGAQLLLRLEVELKLT